ncbi:MAG: DUF1599 domain-containing protein [Bacteroidaceae bacterium]|nr:DUF1599 domain-containing protein [Bacteroidaceae bacterium]
MTTEEQFRQVMAMCREVFVAKLHDYGAAWRILRIPSLTDQLYIKANRIRSLEVKSKSLVGEGIMPEFVAIVNYAVIGLIQLCHGVADKPDDMSADEALAEYDRLAEQSLQLMLRKNHDYDEAWRGMRVSSYTDLILQKIFRTKQIEVLGDEELLASEGIDANYMDMMNYAAFALIKLNFGDTL